MEQIIMYSTTWCGDCRRAKRFFDEHGVAYENIDIEGDTAAAQEVLRINGGMRRVPTILFPDGTVLVEPSNQELAAAVSAPKPL
jgi:mycoredoxin